MTDHSHHRIPRNTSPTVRPESRATRRMSAGVYLDRDLRDLVFTRILRDSRRRVAPSYGHDIVPVVVHSRRALAIDLGVQACCFAVLVLVSLHQPFAAITTLLAFAAWPGAHRDETPEDHEGRRKSASLLMVAAVAYTAAVLRHWPEQAGTLLPAALSALAPIIGLVAAGALLRRHLANLAATAEPTARPSSRRLRRIDEQQRSDLVLYRRLSAEPARDVPLSTPSLEQVYIGAGTVVHRWLPPISVPLIAPGPAAEKTADVLRRTPPREHVKPPFAVQDCVDALAAAIREVGGREPGALPGLRVTDRFYAEEMSDAYSRLPGPLSAADRTEIINDPYNDVRHVLEISTTATGDVVTTVLLRVTLVARTLNLDFTACALTPLRGRYELPEQEYDTTSLLRDAARAAMRWPRELSSGLTWLDLPSLAAGRAGGWAEALVRRRGVGRGSTISARAEAAILWSDAAVEASEITSHVWIIQERLLRAAKHFLDDHDVDTAQLERRARMIINANVLNMGRMDIIDSQLGDHNTRTAAQAAAGGEGEE